MLKNRDIFLDDPTAYSIPNNGVTEVLNPRTPQEWNVLRYELSHFVCEGEYQRGLQLILSTYIDNLSKAKQPAVWVSGFYGSGKSHFVRVLEYLWRDTEFPDGVKARGLAKLPEDISDQFKELTILGKREGGLWSAAGTLGAGAGKSVRFALLSIMFRSAGLPEQYAPARFVIWLKQNGFYKDVKTAVERKDKDLAKELTNMYVSLALTQSLLDVYPGFANTPAEARSLLKTQYPSNEDISDDELLSTMEDVLDLQSTMQGKRPCMLLIFDELQQFLGDDSQRTLQVQNIVEACSSRFGNQLLFVATGQASILATPQLQKLQGRFTIRVGLSDTDVERVVREVVLRKNPIHRAALQMVLDTASGEINRHLAGTKIGSRPTDGEQLISDYPLLPVRSRFWESVLRAVDSMGTAGQLRTQLRIVHETTRDIANSPLGTVITGDIIYHQLKTDMLLGGVLLRDIDTFIEKLDDGTPEGKLCSRLCSTIFLIDRLPKDGVAATGLRSNVATLADLMVDNVTDVQANVSLRQHIPRLLQNLVDAGTLMKDSEEYRLQTRESAEWEKDYQLRRGRIRADDARIASDRTTEFQNAINRTLKSVAVTQGLSKTPRKPEFYFSSDTPPMTNNNVPVWVRDEWSVSERTVREDAQAAGIDSPIVFIFLPQQEADALKDTFACYAAAQDTISSRPTPTSTEGQQARNAMESKRQMEQNKRDTIINNIINNTRVYQGGGNDVAQGSVQASVKTAVEAALVRLFPNFKLVDHSSWHTVISRTMQGATDALSAIGYNGDIDKHPACQEIRIFIGIAGKKGSDIRKYFMGAGYGWPQDAVDGALLCLVAGGFVRAAKNSQPVTVKQLTTPQIGQTDFSSEGITITSLQRIGLRKLIIDIGLQVKPNEETEATPLALKRLLELARSAGGDAPLPEGPSTELIEKLQSASGNEQLVATYERREELLNNFKVWTQASQKITQRHPQWQILQKLLMHASSLSIADEVDPHIQAIKNARTLLHDPDPVLPLIDQVATALRTEIQSLRQRLIEAQDREMQDLESSQEWQGLTEAQRQRLLQHHSLGPIGQLNIGTNEDLLTTFNTTGIKSWEDKIAAPKGRVQKVREEVAKLLAPAEITVTLTPHHATLKSAVEVDAYLVTLRSAIIKHIETGKTVII